MIRRTSYATRDPEKAQAFFAEAYTGAIWRGAIDRGAFQLLDRRIDAGPFQIDRVRMASRVVSTFRPDDVYFVTYLAEGSIRMEQPGVDEMVVAGEVVLAGQAGVDAKTDADDIRQDVVTVSVAAVREAAGLDPGRDENPEFASVRPLTAGRTRTWQATRAYLQAVLADVDAGESSLLIGSANRLLATLLLETFPNSVRRASSAERRDRRDAHGPGSLRRAVSFIERNAGGDIGIADIARAASVTPRAVEFAFRRHLGTTPTAYLRQVRLDHAHRELLGAVDGDRLTVSEVAYRWGFSSPSRFSEYYRRAFGKSPRETLRA
jgi:AraC-like DNA-binding protein